MRFGFLTATPERLQTTRLVLEPLEVRHAAEMTVVLADPELHRHVGGRPLSLEELRTRYEHQVRGRSDDGAERWFNWILRAGESGLAVGYVQATVGVATGIADLAWVIGSPFQGNAFAGEAASAMVEWLRRQGVVAVTAHLHPDNAASAAVARAIGLAPSSTVVDGEVRWELSPRVR
ncbi:MAG TPA: GNAT family N-acetyltransferase [Gaiellaceae bacterium]